MQTRDEDRVLNTTRLEKGNIDRRLIAELGFNNTKVFKQTLVNTTTPIYVHISIDASGSMHGVKWFSAVKTAIAIATATSMTSSIHCVVSIRGAYDEQPLTWVLYDSKKDRLSKFTQLMKVIDCNASTPEGLCFETLQKDLIKDSKNKEAYFINLSDGLPMFGNGDLYYVGLTAIRHTKHQVSKLREANIQLLSYFINDSKKEDIDAKAAFTEMYGKDAVFINTDNLSQLAKSLNDLFVRK